MSSLQLTFIGHLEELRKRVIIMAVALILGAALSYMYVDVIVDYITKPASGLEFIYLSPPELFLAYVKISLIVGAVIASPIIAVQTWLFIKPGLEPKEKKLALFAFFMAIIFFCLGVAFAYFIIIPMTIQFFVRMAVDQIEPLFSFANYISFISSLLLSFGLVFELPLIILLLTQLNLVSPDTFKRYRKFFVLGIFVVAALLTPPDVISQSLMAVPMILLYEFSIVLSVIMSRKKKKQV